MQRRHLLQGLLASGAGALGLSGCASVAGSAGAGKARVLVVGGGYGGATVSKYIRLLSDQSIDVMMVEPNRQFVSCPVSNLVIGGQRTMDDITRVGLYLTNLSQFAAVNAVMGEYFAQPYPARSTIEVPGLPKGAAFEVDALMVLPQAD